jgi:PAS domain S-box-containing protein
VADNTYDWEFWIDPEGKFIYCSPACECVTGHSATEFLADADLLRRITHPDDLSRFDRHRGDVSQNTRPGELDWRIILPDGTERWISHVCIPVFDDNGEFLGIRGSNRDITERMSVERLKDEMISAVSHELRTPLTAVLGFTEFLLEHRVTEAELKEYLVASS